MPCTRAEAAFKSENRADVSYKYEMIVSIDLLHRYISKRAIDQDEIDVEHCIVLNLVLDMNKRGCRLSIELNYSINIGALATTVKDRTDEPL